MHVLMMIYFGNGCTHMTGALKAKVPADEGARDDGIDLVDQAGHDAEISVMPWGGD